MCEIPGVGRATVEPVDDVVDLDEPIGGASRYPAGTIAAFEDAAGAIGHDALCAAHRERHAGTFPHRLADIVAR